jgi:outer membrane protein assembly factor BamB
MKLSKNLYIILVFLAGCSGITIEQNIKISPGDWVMAGGSPEQKNVSDYTLAPPLNLMWDYNIEGGVSPNGITTADAVVFVNVLQGEMFSFDVTTGGKIGNIKFLGKEAATAPLIMGNDVIVAYAGDKSYSLASYNLSRGEISWRKNYGFIQTSPILKDGYIYFGNLNGVQYKVDASSGHKTWKFSSRSPIHSTCAVSDDKVIFGNDDGLIYCLNTSDGGNIWKYETTAPVLSTPMANDSVVYLGCDDSNYYALNISDGKWIWKNNMHTKMIGGSSVFQNEQVIFGCVDGSVYSLNKTDGSVKWKFETRGTITSTPLISGIYVYCTSYDSYIYCLNAYTGKMLWSQQLENKSKTTPVIWKEYLFVAADDFLYCFTSKTVEKKD